jgi:hypothetical protein
MIRYDVGGGESIEFIPMRKALAQAQSKG